MNAKATIKAASRKSPPTLWQPIFSLSLFRPDWLSLSQMFTVTCESAWRAAPITTELNDSRTNWRGLLMEYPFRQICNSSCWAVRGTLWRSVRSWETGGSIPSILKQLHWLQLATLGASHFGAVKTHSTELCRLHRPSPSLPVLPTDGDFYRNGEISLAARKEVSDLFSVIINIADVTLLKKIFTSFKV